MNASEFRRRLIDRAAAVSVALTDATAQRLQQYFDLLARWNTKINLTALPLLRAPDDAIARLLIEPLVVAQRLDETPLQWVDLGSGGGSPAIPMKLYRPNLRLTMVESKIRKAAFLREASRVLELGDTAIENLRVEELVARGDWHGAVELITTRGVRVDPRVLSQCRTLLAQRGRLIVFGAKALPTHSGFAPTAVPWFFERCST